MLINNRLATTFFLLLFIGVGSNVMAQSSSTHLPKWFAQPQEGEYVGVSFPSDDVRSRHETAIVSALFNYVAGLVCDGKAVDTHITSDGFSTRAKSQLGVSFPIRYQVIHLESVGNHTYAAVKIDTINTRKDYCLFMCERELLEIDNSMSFFLKAKLELVSIGKYEISQTWSHNDSSEENNTTMLLFGEQRKISEEISGRIVDNIEWHNYQGPEWTMSELKNQYDRYVSEDDNIGFIYWEAMLEEFYHNRLLGIANHKYKNSKNEITKGNFIVEFKHTE